MNERLGETEAAEERYRLQIAAQIGAVRQAVDENRTSNHSLSHTLPMALAEQPALRSQLPLDILAARSNDQPSSATDELLQGSGTFRDNAIPSAITTNNFTFGAPSPVPNITINVTASSPERNKRHIASESEKDAIIEREPPPALSTRSRKRARRDRL
ncbi:hypothetical protein PSPO01_16455 [Paraphaeosphaeria sporulosa]